MEANRQIAPTTAPVAVRESAGSFVINLCSSTTPMALTKPKDSSLERFKFFVSRRREDGRERFRLHMGYFESLVAAEEVLAIVREVYPSAWAGEAPGRKLKPSASNAQPAVAVPAAAEPSADTVKMATVQAAPAPAADPVKFLLEPNLPRDIPTVHPGVPPVVEAPIAPPKKASEPQARAAAAVAKEAAAKQAAAKQAAAEEAAAKEAAAKQTAAAEKAAVERAAAEKAAAQRIAAAKVAAEKAAAEKAAAEQAAAEQAAAKAAAEKAAAAAKQVMVAQPAATHTRAAVPAPQKAGASQKPVAPQSNIREVIAELDELSDTSTLRILEGRTGNGDASSADDTIPLVRPEDTQTMRAIKEDVQRKAPVSFAVQLDWSVQPFDITKVPPLAIFSAYTLYTAEANRDGRRWYGLRLGFFSDAISAKQVAYYVRSDFASVAVVPVSSDEKQRATAANPAAVSNENAPKSAQKSGDLFQLLEDDTPAPIELDVVGETSPRRPKTPPAVAPAADAGTNRKESATPAERPRPASRAQSARAKASPQRLDETLEILGADDLEIDSGRGELLSESGVRHLRVHVDKRTSKFTSLLDRLAAKLGRS